jgi:peroxiredoxin
MSLKAGDAAPSFALYDTEKQLLSLEDFKGKRMFWSCFSTSLHQRLHKRIMCCTGWNQ